MASITPEVLTFYGIGGMIAIIGLIVGICGSFDSSAWWPIITGSLLGIVGLLVQLGILNPPKRE